MAREGVRGSRRYAGFTDTLGSEVSGDMEVIFIGGLKVSLCLAIRMLRLSHQREGAHSLIFVGRF